MEILTLLKGNIKNRKGNFFSIFIFMIIISSLTISVLSLNRNMGKRAYEANEEVNTGDLIVFMYKEFLTEDVLEELRNSNIVKDLQVKDTVLMDKGTIENKKITTTVYISTADFEKYPYKIKGDINYNLNNNDILLPIAMENSYGAKIGDQVNINNELFIVKGFFEEPLMGCDLMGAKNFLVSKEAYNLLNESGRKGVIVSIFGADEYKGQGDKLRKEVNEISNIISLGFTSLTIDKIISYTLLISNIICGTLIAFVILLLIIVILVICNNISTNIEMEYVNLGILKSQGFTVGQIRLVLLLQYLFPTVTGSFIGGVLSIFLLNFLSEIFLKTSGLLFSKNINIGISSIIFIAVILFMGIIIYLKTRNISKISPVTAISGGMDNIYFKSILENKIISNSRRFLNLKLALRGLTSNLKQYLGSLVILSLLVLFLSLTASFKQTFTEESYNELFGIVASDIYVDLKDSDLSFEEIDKAISEEVKIKDSFYQGVQYVLIDGNQELSQIIEDSKYLKSILEGRGPIYDNEIVITNVVKNSLKKTIGDEVEIKYGNTSETFIIVGIYDSCSDVGNSIAMIKGGALKLNPQLHLNDRSYILEDSSKTNEVINSLNSKYQNKNIAVKSGSVLGEEVMNTVIKSSDMAIYFIYCISLIFTVLVIWVLCSKTFNKERKNIGVLKSFGFTTFHLRLQFSIRFLIISMVSAVFGCGAYLIWGDKINALVLSLAGASSFYAEKTFFNVVLPPIIISVSVFLTTFIIMSKTKKVEVKELILE